MAKTVRITEPTWRKIDRLLKDEQASRTVLPLTGAGTNIIRVRNNTADIINRFGALGVSGSVIEMAPENPSHHIIVDGYTPSAIDHANGKFVICAEPIQSGKIGRAYAAGITAAIVNVVDESHTYADIDDGQYCLKSAESGTCAILWKESGTGQLLAIVRFGGVGGTATSEAMCEIRRSLLWPDAARDPLDGPPEGYSQYVVAIDEVALWDVNQLIEVGDLRRNAEGIVFIAIIAHMIQEGAHDEPTLEEPTEYWRLYCPLPPCQEGLALIDEEIDYRDYAAWFEIGDIVPLRRKVNALTGKTTYLFDVRMMRTREHGMTIQSLLYDPDERRSKVVFGDAETEFEGT